MNRELLVVAAIISLSPLASAMVGKGVSRNFHCDDAPPVTINWVQSSTLAQPSFTNYRAQSELVGKLEQVECDSLDRNLLQYGENICLANNQATLVMVARSNKAILRSPKIFRRAALCIAFN